MSNEEEFLNYKINQLFYYTSVLQCIASMDNCNYDILAYFLTNNYNLEDICEDARILVKNDFIKRTEAGTKEERADFLIPLLRRMSFYFESKIKEPITEEELVLYSKANDYCDKIEDKLMPLIQKLNRGRVLKLGLNRKHY